VQGPSERQLASWVPVAHACNPGTQEAETRRTEVQSQPGQIVLQTLSRKNPSHTHKKGLVKWLKV
jgi:hypothetical protein